MNNAITKTDKKRIYNIIFLWICNFTDSTATATGPGGQHDTNNFWTSGRRTSDSCNSAFIWKAGVGQAQRIGYTNWIDGEPNCDRKTEYCLTIRKDSNELAGQWNDAPCSARHGSVCEIVEYQH